MIDITYEEFHKECIGHTDSEQTMCWCNVQDCRFLRFCNWRVKQKNYDSYGFKLTKLSFNKCKLIYIIEEAKEHETT